MLVVYVCMYVCLYYYVLLLGMIRIILLNISLGGISFDVFSFIGSDFNLCRKRSIGAIDLIDMWYIGGFVVGAGGRG